MFLKVVDIVLNQLDIGVWKFLIITLN